MNDPAHLPDSLLPADIHHRLGLQFHRAGDAASSLLHFQRAAQLDENNAQALYNLATIHFGRNELTQARDIYERCIEREPEHLKARNNLAAIHRQAGRLTEAIAQFRAALRLAPDSCEITLNLAAALCDNEQYEEATTLYNTLLAGMPNDPATLRGLARSLEKQGEYEAARSTARRYTASCPGNLLAQLRADLLAPEVCSTMEELATLKQECAHALSRYETRNLTLDVVDIPYSSCKPPLILAYGGGDSLPQKRALAAAIARHVPEDRLAARSGKPRVGFLATRHHEAVFLRGMAELLNRLDSKRFELFAITSATGERQARRSLRNDTVQTIALPDTFPEMLTTLRDLRLDLLYFWEIGTDPVNYFLPFFRTAPVQCTGWGWPVTSGIEAVDYFVSSEFLDAPTADCQYSERLIRFPKLPNVYRRPLAEPVRWSRDDFGFGARDHIYFCPQNPLKLTPEQDELFLNILQQDPASRLLLMSDRRPHVTEAIHRRLVSRAPDVADRLQFVPRTSGAQFRALLQTADVLLDSLHYCGGANTNFDALALNKPVVTLPTEFHRGRYTEAMYRQLGVTDTVASSPDDYVRLALQLANEPEFHRDISKQLEQTSDLIFEDISAVAAMENFLDEAIGTSRTNGAA